MFLMLSYGHKAQSPICSSSIVRSRLWISFLYWMILNLGRGEETFNYVVLAPPRVFLVDPFLFCRPLPFQGVPFFIFVFSFMSLEDENPKKGEVHCLGDYSCTSDKILRKLPSLVRPFYCILCWRVEEDLDLLFWNCDYAQSF